MKSPTSPNSTERAPVAVVGIGCRFPGGVSGPESFWRFLSEGGDAIGLIPPDRMARDHYYDPRPAQPGHIMTRWGGYLEHIEDFDAAFFGISPREAERMDPQQRLLCETAWEALEDAGHDARRLAGTRTGVFVGEWLSDFEARLFADPAGVDFYMTLGSGRYAASGRLSYVFDLRGPSVTLDTACSSSLVAIHLAAKSVQRGESDLALAGGVNVILQPHITIAYSQSRMMSPDGRCKFGDASADGYVRSEGAAIVVLKALDRALADGDRIYAVIRGSAVNNDGRSSGSMGTVSQVGQEELLRAAYRDAGLSPAHVGYAEAHGTGTQGGDPVELAALGAVLSESREPGERAFVGSVKTNIGHTEGAAGAAGFIKAALSLHHGGIPASLHFKQPSPKVSWSELPLEIPTSHQAWSRRDGPRVAGVNAFGIAGTNAHVVLEEAPQLAPAPPLPARRLSQLFVLSAKSREALVALAVRHAERLEGAKAPDLRDLCFTAATRRTGLEYRAAFVADDGPALALALRRFEAGEPARAEGTCSLDAGARPKIVFVCPGQGAQWLGMGRKLAAEEPVFRSALEACDEAATKWADFRILEQLYLDPAAPGYRLGDIDVIQPALVALAIAYAKLFESLGVVPDAVIGHSMGEVAAAYLSGILDMDRAMQIICRRSALMRRAAGRGAMALVELPMEAARARIEKIADRVAVAGNNSPRASVLSGDPEAVSGVLAELEREGVFCRLVKVDVASHSPQMQPLAEELSAELEGLVPGPAKIPMYSTVLARRADGDEFGASYWGRNLRQTVLFGMAVDRLLADGATTFVELGPHPVLSPSIQQTAQAGGKEVTTLVCGRREEPETPSILAALGGLWTAGYPVDFRKLMPEGGRTVSLPSYPWQRERLWVQAAELVAPGAGPRGGETGPTEEALGWVYRLTWTPAPISGSEAGSESTRWLIAAQTVDQAAPLVAALSRSGARTDATSLEELDGVLERARTEGDGRLRGVVVLAPERGDVAYLPIRVLSALQKSPWRSSPRLWFVTRGAQAVTESPGERVATDQGALWGTARVIAEEHPDVWGGLVDLDPASQAEAASALLTQHLLAPGGEEQVALRGGERLALRLTRHTRGSAPAFVARADCAYLVTGGLGDVGLHVARALAARGARRLILLGRSPLPPRDTWAALPVDAPFARRVAAVRQLEAEGVAVHVATLDVGDESAVRSFLERYAAEGWPPIRGVIHAAAVVDDHLALEMRRPEFDAVIRPKLRGAEILDRALPDLDLFVMFSSIVGVFGLSGAANYAAANAGLDALAHDRRARGLPALSVAWGVWEQLGLAEGQVTAEFARQGVRGFSGEQGTSVLTWLCASAPASVVVLAADWAAFRRARAGRGARLYGELVEQDGGAPSEGETSSVLSDADPAERRKVLERLVKDAVAKVLKIAPSRLDARRTFGSMGLSSLLSMELRNRLEAALGRSLSATLAYNYPTVSALVDYLAGGSESREPTTAEATPAAGAPEATEELREIAELSDEDAMLALRGKRSRGKS